MKLLMKYPLRILSTLGALAFSMSSLLAEDPIENGAAWQEPWWLGQHTPQLHADVLREEGQSTFQFEVYYPGKQDVETLDDNDLWVVSKAGFNQNAALVEAREVGIWEASPREEWPDDFVDERGQPVDPAIFGEEIFGVLATYAIRAEAGAWEPEDNGAYVVLLEPQQVSRYERRFFDPAWLGSLRVGVGEPEPLPPTAEAEIPTRVDWEDAVQISVTYRDEFGLALDTIGTGDLYVAMEHSETLEPILGEIFYMHEVRLVNVDASDDGREAVATYEIVSAWAQFGFDWEGGPTLFPGKYTVQLHQNAVCDLDGLCVAAQPLGSFEVTGDLPEVSVPEGELSVTKLRRGYQANLQLDLAPGTWVQDWGTPTLEGDTFTIDLKLAAFRFPTVGDADDPDIFVDLPLRDWFGAGYGTSYWLGTPEPGKYRIAVRYEGQEVASTDFKAETIDPNAIPVPEGGIIVEEGDGGYIATLELGLDGEVWVSDWGTPTLEDGSTFRIDLELSTFDHIGFDPDVEGVDEWGGIPFPEAYYQYNLGQPEPGEYTVAVYYRDALITSTAFEARDLGSQIRARLIAESIEEETTEPYQFTISWVAGPDPDIDHLQTANVMVSNADRGFQGQAEIVDIAVAESFPPQVQIRYQVTGPGGSWDADDNGFYQVQYLLIPKGVDPTVVRVAAVSVGRFAVWIGEDGFVVDPLPVDQGIGGPGVEVPGFPPNLDDFQEWMGRWAPEAGANADEEVALVKTDADFDGDGLTNWEEYAFGTDPMNAQSRAKPIAAVMQVEGVKHLAIHFQQSLEAQVTPVIWISKDLQTWMQADESLVDIEHHDGDDGQRQVVACLRESMEASEYRYVRLGLAPVGLE